MSRLDRPSQSVESVRERQRNYRERREAAGTCRHCVFPRFKAKMCVWHYRQHHEKKLKGDRVSDVTKLGPAPERVRLPDVRAGHVRKISIGSQKVYVRTGEYPDGRLGEIFLTADPPDDPTSETDTLSRGLLDAVAVAVSIGLQVGVPLEVFCQKFEHTKFEPSGPTGDPALRFAQSALDAVFRYLRLRYVGPVGDEVPLS